MHISRGPLSFLTKQEHLLLFQYGNLGLALMSYHHRNSAGTIMAELVRGEHKPQDCYNLCATLIVLQESSGCHRY